MRNLGTTCENPSQGRGTIHNLLPSFDGLENFIIQQCSSNFGYNFAPKCCWIIEILSSWPDHDFCDVSNYLDHLIFAETTKLNSQNRFHVLIVWKHERWKFTSWYAELICQSQTELRTILFWISNEIRCEFAVNVRQKYVPFSFNKIIEARLRIVDGPQDFEVDSIIEIDRGYTFTSYFPELNKVLLLAKLKHVSSPGEPRPLSTSNIKPFEGIEINRGGLVCFFGACFGTGGGRSAQDSPKINFSSYSYASASTVFASQSVRVLYRPHNRFFGRASIFNISKATFAKNLSRLRTTTCLGISEATAALAYDTVRHRLRPFTHDLNFLLRKTTQVSKSIEITI